jgi:hypothetical protein
MKLVLTYPAILLFSYIVILYLLNCNTLYRDNFVTSYIGIQLVYLVSIVLCLGIIL